jgi:hypothetical protein
MKKILLTLLGVVGISVSVGAQTFPQVGEVLQMSNQHEFVNGGWTVIGLTEPGLGEGSPKIVTVQKGDAFGELLYWNGTDFDEFNFGTQYLGSDGSPAYWGGSINNWGGHFYSFDEEGNETNLDFPAGYIQYSGGYYGAGAAEALAAQLASQGGAFVEQAQELNIGLTFLGGQWAPAE